jgi:sugar/nucleoside kinase (ribokinase family)
VVKVQKARKPSPKKTRPAVRRPAHRRRELPARGDLAVGVGLATVDLMCVVPRVEHRLVEVSVFSMQGGGSATNILAVLAMLGVRGRYFGRVGDDEFGRFILRSLQQLRIDTSMLSIEEGKVSPVSVIQIDELSHQRKILLSRGNVTALSTRDLPDRLLDGARLLCIDGSQPALQAAVAEKARGKGITVLLNASQLSGGMGELLTLSDIVIASERFANELAPSDELANSLREITSLGPRTAVITMGEAGAVALEGTKLVQQDAIDVFVADTTGAGDAFCGAFAYAQLKGWPLERALPFANATAGLACRSLGSRSGLPTVDEVVEAIKRG